MRARAPLLIAHRGASGERPEHTLDAYRLAIAQGADCIEPDLVMTRDGVLVARHENEIGGTTDVAAHADFAARRRTQHVDGVATTGWFVEDFTFAELRTLRARERIPALRPASAAHDGECPVPTFEEILALAARTNAERRVAGRPLLGVYPEIKHPSHFAALGLGMEAPLLGLLAQSAGDTPLHIQSFETQNLRWLAERCAWPLVQLVELGGGPWDRRHAATFRDYDALLTDAGLREIAAYARVLGVHKQRVIPRDAQGRLTPPTDLVARAHAAGLEVHAWTFRAENEFLPAEYRDGSDPAAHGALEREIRVHLDAGIDGLFCDFPASARRAIDRAG